MNPTARRKLGKSALAVTQLGFRARIPEAEAVATITAAHDAGLRFFDTSPYYGYGRAELRLGSALRDMPRDDLVVSSKIAAGCRLCGQGWIRQACARAG